MGRLGNTNLISASVYNRIMLVYGMIWNRMESECGGERGIRTLGTVARTRDFQSRTFGHSVTSPEQN